MSAHIGLPLPLEGSAIDGRLSYLDKRTVVLEVRRLTTTRDHSHRDLAAMEGHPAPVPGRKARATSSEARSA